MSQQKMAFAVHPSFGITLIAVSNLLLMQSHRLRQAQTVRSLCEQYQQEIHACQASGKGQNHSVLLSFDNSQPTDIYRETRREKHNWKGFGYSPIFEVSKRPEISLVLLIWGPPYHSVILKRSNIGLVFCMEPFRFVSISYQSSVYSCLLHYLHVLLFPVRQ